MALPRGTVRWGILLALDRLLGGYVARGLQVLVVQVLLTMCLAAA